MKKVQKTKERNFLKIFLAIVFGLFIVSFITLVGLCIDYHYIQFENVQTDTYTLNSVNELRKDDYLTVVGDKIFNEKGNTVVLQGVNLGGWLLQEYWMCPVKGNEEIDQWTNLETLDVLEKRFGEQKTQELVQTYEDNWITEWDIENIASLGCNVVRVPFWYRNFMKNPTGDWINDDLNMNPGFQRLDWIIDTAGKYGLYVILDMHGCPGGQSEDHCAGSARRSELFTVPEYQDAMEKLWVAIAERYQGNPVVAAYDIMNEAQAPTESIGSDPRNSVYDRMYKAIRKVDPEHIIIMEGIWDLSVLPIPETMGWTNVMYEVHPYGVSDTEAECQRYVEYSQAYHVPIYIGEFSDPSWYENCRKHGLHFTSWTYKGDQYMDEPWFMYYADKMLAADVYHDPYWLIKLKWGKCLNTRYFVENQNVRQLWIQ